MSAYLCDLIDFDHDIGLITARLRVLIQRGPLCPTVRFEAVPLSDNCLRLSKQKLTNCDESAFIVYCIYFKFYSIEILRLLLVCFSFFT